MTILWLDINSSYAHSSVALPSLHAVCGDMGLEWKVVRATVNDDPGRVAGEVFSCKPDVIAATCWLFTRDFLLSVLARCKALVPECKVILGGPEFLGDNRYFLEHTPFVDCVLRGEGEDVFGLWLSVAGDRSQWASVPGLCYMDGGYADNGRAVAAFGDGMHFPEESRFFCWDKPFVQIETTRGCFNTCAFCVSGGEKPVRVISEDIVRRRLELVRSKGIRDVRVLDRTFNYNEGRALRLLGMFEEFAGDIRFHLEVHPALLASSVREKLAGLPAGLLHLEAGIQSLDDDVLRLSGRNGSVEKALDGLRFLSSLRNVAVHADLIAGLPGYGPEQLESDVLELAGIGVDEIQLESLKLLPGTVMRRDAGKLGLVYAPLPPYEILRSDRMEPEDMKRAMRLSRMIDGYYNAGAWQSVFRELIVSEPEFMGAFLDYLTGLGVADSPLALERRGVLLYEFCTEYYPHRAVDITLAWIMAGMSLKKKPASMVRRMSHSEMLGFVRDVLPSVSVTAGSLRDSMRMYRMDSGSRTWWFGYESEFQQNVPGFIAWLSN